MVQCTFFHFENVAFENSVEKNFSSTLKRWHHLLAMTQDSSQYRDENVVACDDSVTVVKTVFHHRLHSSYPNICIQYQNTTYNGVRYNTGGPTGTKWRWNSVPIMVPTSCSDPFRNEESNIFSRQNLLIQWRRDNPYQTSRAKRKDIGIVELGLWMPEWNTYSRSQAIIYRLIWLTADKRSAIE